MTSGSTLAQGQGPGGGATAGGQPGGHRRGRGRARHRGGRRRHRRSAIRRLRHTRRDSTATASSALPAGATGPGGGIVVNPGKARPARRRWTSTRTSSARSAASSRSSSAPRSVAWPRPATSSWSTHTMSFLDDNLHNDSSLRAASAAACAADAGRFGPYHDAVFAGQPAKEGAGLHRRPARGLRADRPASPAAPSAPGSSASRAASTRPYAQAVQTQSEKDGVVRHPDPQAQRQGAGPAEAHPEYLTAQVKAATK